MVGRRMAGSCLGATGNGMRLAMSWLTTYALSLPVEYRPQTTCLHPALYCAAASIFLQLLLYLKPAVHISCSRSYFQVFPGRRLQPCGSSTCLVLLPSLLLNMSKPVLLSTYLIGYSFRQFSSIVIVISGQAVEMGLKPSFCSFFTKKLKKPKSPNFVDLVLFRKKTFKIQILDSQLGYSRKLLCSL